MPSNRPLQWFSVAGKIALITGGSSGLGYAMAQAYLECGARVYVTGRKKSQLDVACERLAAHGDVRAIQGDVSSSAGIEAIRQALAEEERVHVLINNAGITWGATIEKFPAAAWDSVMAVNVKAPFTMAQSLLEKLRAAAVPGDPSRIVNVGSVYGLSSQVLGAWSYGASKAAVHHLTRMLASELAPTILVNAIAPGFFPSKMTNFITSDTERMAEMCGTIPLGRAGTPDDIGALALYLGSRASAYMTGNIIPLDGGVLAKL